MKTIFVGSVWRHHKNGLSYVVESTPMNPNTEDLFVVYRRVDAAVGEQRYVRPTVEFLVKFQIVDLFRDTRAPRSFA